MALRFGICAALVAAFSAAMACAQAAPSRIVSLNLCTDQMLLELAAPEQIASLSRLARDPALSVFHLEANDFPSNRGAAEEVIALEPDLVLTGAYSTTHTTTILRQLGYRVETFTPATSLSGARENIRRMGELIGAAARAAQVISQIDTAIAASNGRDGDGQARPVFATYDVNGWTTGDGSMIAEIAELAGFETLSSRLGFSGMRQVSLEQLLVSSPDVIDFGDDYSDPPSRGTNALRHPALAALSNDVLVVNIAGRDTGCASSALVRPIELLMQARQRLMP